MGIEFMSGFGQVSPYYSRAYEIPTVTPEEVRSQDEQRLQETDLLQQGAVAVKREETAPDNRSKTANLENVSLTFNKEESFDYLGSESNLLNLDMQKAISDMKKDSILQEYQYFVGNSQDFMMNPEDGVFFQK